MGRDVHGASPAARAVFDSADEALGFALSKLCFEGPDDQLKLTENTQPALLTVSIAAHAALTEMGYKGDFAAGHSLGEYSALVAAGALKFTDAVKLVRNRGRYMQQAVPAGVGAMAAVQLGGEALDGDPMVAAGTAAAAARRAGVITRAIAGGGLQVSPPLVITRDQLDDLAAGLRAGLDAI